ncbi:hypothetical protein BUALT_Bualt14G0014500 [Buddleja alternifolia]|uniref:DUF4219 domain-containing protein n=1 Tax=Buddleja alternifolia TaxID=168488 RepID=A0AAV6WR07_9LAMI|nr:hypothetical protein BUALT_Bualt14G0014500 [Buddleja alternifolia]
MVGVMQTVNVSDIKCEIPELNGDNYKVWKERILLHLGWMDIDYAIRKDEPPAITVKALQEMLFFMNGGSDLIASAINEQFVISDKALASILIMRIVESRNAKFLENDLISGSDQSQNIISEKDHMDIQPPTSSDRLIVIYNTPQVQMDVEQPIVEVPQFADNDMVDPVVQELPEASEQPVNQHTSHEDVASKSPDRTNEVTGVYAEQCVTLAKELALPLINLWAKMQETNGWQKKILRHKGVVCLNVLGSYPLSTDVDHTILGALEAPQNRYQIWL